jgi:hypothetical protein
MAYGMQIYNASGALTIDYVDRLARFVQAGTINLSGGYIDITIPGMANNDSWTVLLGSIPFIFTYSSAGPDVYYTKSTNNLRITGGSYNNIKYYVYRT